MRTYLVTGGAGFIGSNYIHYMFRKYGGSIRIINVDALTYAGNLENLKDVEKQNNYTFIRADIRCGAQKAWSHRNRYPLLPEIHTVQEKGRLGERYNIGGHNEKQNIEIINITGW